MLATSTYSTTVRQFDTSSHQIQGLRSALQFGTFRCDASGSNVNTYRWKPLFVKPAVNDEASSPYISIQSTMIRLIYLHREAFMLYKHACPAMSMCNASLPVHAPQNRSYLSARVRVSQQKLHRVLCVSSDAINTRRAGDAPAAATLPLSAVGQVWSPL